MLKSRSSFWYIILLTDQAEGTEEEGGNPDNMYQTVTSPCLVSAISQLVRNLIIQAPQDTVSSLKNEALLPFFVR